MSTLLVVNTTKRENGFSYFNETIKRIDATGGAGLPKEDKLIYCDGPFEGVAPEGWTVRSTAESTGTLPGLEAVVKLARERQQDLAFFEDDIVLSKNAVKKIVEYEVPADLAFVSFFDFYTPAGAKAGLEERAVPDKGVIQSGVQAIKIPLRSLALMWPDKQHAEIVVSHEPGEKQFGRLFALRYYFKGLRFGMLLPHIVQHIGEVTAVHITRARPAGDRKSANYAGDECDAMALG
jgi:hypothetical protein